MKNFTDSDYALNKHSENIVYRFADGIVVVTLADYLAENPDKTPTDFQRLKEESDAIFFEQDRDEYSQTYKNTLLGELEKYTASCAQSPEEVLINAIDVRKETKKRKKRMTVASYALDKLTDIQRKRYLLYVAKGLTMREIAEMEEVAHQSVAESLMAAEKKIKKFLKDN